MKKLLLFIINFCFVAAMGQNLIAPITISLPANPPANTADWATAMPPVMIMAQTKMQNGQIYGVVIESKILVTIKSGGTIICGSYNPQTAPQSNFNSVTKTWSGAAVLSLLGKDCILKPGTYELCVQFYGRRATPAMELIGEACKSFTIADTKQQSYSPPQNIVPVNGKVFTEQEAGMPIMLRWTPVLPKPKEDVLYKVRLYEVVKGTSNAQAIKSGSPVETIEVKNITQTSFKLAPRCNDCEWVWNVEASKKSAVGDIEMLGTSEETSFSVSSNETLSFCDCGGWELFTVNNKNYTCGQKIKWNCNEPIDFSARYNCKPNDGSCVARIECDVKKDGVIIKNFGSGPHPYIDHAKFTPTENGVYTITLYPTCNGKPCPPCIITFTVTDCKTNSACDCKSAQCTKKLWYKDVSTGIIKEFVCSNQTPIILNCDKNYHFFADTICSPDPNCKMTAIGEFRNEAGALVIQPTAFSNTIAFNIISVIPGNYTFIIKYYINGVECSKCTIPIKVTCKPACECGKWSSIMVGNNKYKCGEKIPWKCKVPFSFSSIYYCSPANDSACKATIKWEIKNGGVLINTGFGIGSVSGGFTPAANGVYTLTMTIDCNGKVCETCTFTIVVDSCVECDCGEWGPVKYMYSKDGEKQPWQSTYCGNKTPIIAELGQPYQFISQLNCKPSQCKAEGSKVTVYNESGNVIYSAEGIMLTDYYFKECGKYKVVFSGFCGGRKCEDCVINVEIPCCKCKGEPAITLTEVDGKQRQIKCGVQKYIELKCNSKYTLAATANCSGDNCKSKVLISITGPGINIINALSPVSFVPSQTGSYTATITPFCGTDSCPPCKIIFVDSCICKPCDLNKVVASNTSMTNLNMDDGTVTVINNVTASPNNITKIVADLVAVSITPNNADCNRCDKSKKNQNNFIGENKISTNSSQWNNTGNGTISSNSSPGITRSLTFTSTNSAGVNISGGNVIRHTIGLPPASCCGDKIEVWIRYTVWDNQCRVCDKVLKATLNRPGACVMK